MGRRRLRSAGLGQRQDTRYPPFAPLPPARTYMAVQSEGGWPRRRRASTLSGPRVRVHGTSAPQPAQPTLARITAKRPAHGLMYPNEAAMSSRAVSWRRGSATRPILASWKRVTSKVPPRRCTTAPNAAQGLRGGRGGCRRAGGRWCAPPQGYHVRVDGRFDLRVANQRRRAGAREPRRAASGAAKCQRTCATIRVDLTSPSTIALSLGCSGRAGTTAVENWLASCA